MIIKYYQIKYTALFISAEGTQFKEHQVVIVQARNPEEAVKKAQDPPKQIMDKKLIPPANKSKEWAYTNKPDNFILEDIKLVEIIDTKS